MDNEMYNDGLYFMEQAAKSKGTFEKWRYQRFAVISFASSFESFLNRRILSKLNEGVKKVANWKEIKYFLTFGGPPPKGFSTIKDKIKVTAKLYGVNYLSINSVKFKKFQEVIFLRNSIVHYSASNLQKVYGEKIDNISSQAAKLLRDLVKEYCHLLKLEIPSFYLETNYISIDI